MMIQPPLCMECEASTVPYPNGDWLCSSSSCDFWWPTGLSLQDLAWPGRDPSSLLDRDFAAAAALLEQAAKQATAGKWHFHDGWWDGPVWAVLAEDDTPSWPTRVAVVHVRNGQPARREDAEWITLMSPAVAGPVAGMLRDSRSLDAAALTKTILDRYCTAAMAHHGR